MSAEDRLVLQSAREELKQAAQAMASHKRNAKGSGAEWRGTWDNGHWSGSNSTDLNKKYTTLYIKVQKAQEKVEQALNKADPYRRDLDSTIERLKEQRKRESGSKGNALFNPLFDRLVMVIHRKMEYTNKEDTSSPMVCECTHYFQGRKVPCDCVPDEIGFLSLSDTNEERLKNKRVCFIGDYYYTTGPTWGKPVRGPVQAGIYILRIKRTWFKEGSRIYQKCSHYHRRPSGLIDEPKEIVPCDCIKNKFLYYVNPGNIYVKNGYYTIDSNLPITILRQYKPIGVSCRGTDTFGFVECRHYTNIEGCTPKDVSEQCDCSADGELSEKLKKFDSRGLVEKKFCGTKLNAMSKISISRETRGLIPHPQGHSCRHTREDGGNMECDCIPQFNIHTVDKFEDVIYELSEDMKKRQAAGRVILVDDGKLTIGGFFKNVFFPSSSSSTIAEAKATPYDDDKYVV